MNSKLFALIIFLFNILLAIGQLEQHCDGHNDAINDLQNNDTLKWFHLYNHMHNNVLNSYCKHFAGQYYCLNVESYSPYQECADSLWAYNEVVSQYLCKTYDKNWEKNFDTLFCKCKENIACGIDLDSINIYMGLPIILYQNNSIEIDDRYKCFFDNIFNFILTEKALSQFKIIIFAEISPDEELEIGTLRLKSIANYLNTKTKTQISIVPNIDSHKEIEGIIPISEYYWFRRVTLQLSFR